MLTKPYFSHRTAEADVNRKRVRRWFVAHPGGTQRECSEQLSLSIATVQRHVASIRADWKADADKSAGNRTGPERECPN